MRLCLMDVLDKWEGREMDKEGLQNFGDAPWMCTPLVLGECARD